VRRTLAARQNYPVEPCQIFGSPDVAVRDANAVQHLGVRFVVTLYSENSNGHKGAKIRRPSF
jgi:hypothetical protein